MTSETSCLVADDPRLYTWDRRDPGVAADGPGRVRQGDGQTFGSALRAARVARQVSVRELGRRVHYCHSYVSKVENGVKPPTVQFARQCDEALGLGGTLVASVELSVEPSVPTRSAWPRPIQLPPGPAQLLGRQAESERIGAVLTASGGQPGTVPLVVLDGPPGVGKTALALRWAHENLARFPDGVLFADLRGYAPDATPARPGDILAEFCRALGVFDRIPAGEEQRAALLRSLLTGRRVLLVLDNALDTPQVRPLLPASPNCAVLVTSRRQLCGLSVRDGARSVAVRPLAPATSVALLREIIGERWANAEPEAVWRLATRCGGLPLALRLAGQRATRRSGTSLTEFADEMFAAGSLLDELTADDDPHGDLREVFFWSCRWLDQEAVLAFRVLGGHPGSEFDESTVAALLRSSTAEAAVTVRQLAVAHLIEPTGAGRYRMHELLRLYANELAAEHAPTGVRDRLTRRLRAQPGPWADPAPAP
ncbi:helix-turn-helix domain-containing protein [Streptomyces sp. CG4]|uniref:helix-turn-helix domain-containing protein n=1 Tax=Streptomyces sp. CG4 TaxID=408783 RepID=UPI0034E23C4D